MDSVVPLFQNSGIIFFQDLNQFQRKLVDIQYFILNGAKGVLKETVSFILYIAVVFLATYLVIHYVGQRTQVSGTSMEYTLSDGDNLIVDKISYRFHAPERFDIIVFPFQQEEDTYYIKRIIGLPGETVQIDEAGSIFIDGEIQPLYTK